ncbi:hypothetical protein FQZ97_1064980 [compost metagenome]
MLTALARLTGAAGLPSTRVSSCITTCGKPLGPRMNMPYWSVASSGTLNTSASVRLMPRMSRACALTTAQVAMPPSTTSSAVP